MVKNEDGYIVVETVGTFIPFLLLVISILSLVNIVSMQAQIHHALTQTAKTLSMYAYVLNVTGIADDFIEIDTRARDFENNIRSTIDGILTLDSDEADLDFDFSHTDIINYGLSEAGSFIAASFVRPLVMRYLSGQQISGADLLALGNVFDFRLTRVAIVNYNADVTITARYDIYYAFGNLEIPFGSRLSVTQTVVTKAWLGGSGEGYRG